MSREHQRTTAGTWVVFAALFTTAQALAADPEPTAPAGDYGQRVVAYVYDKIPITREELGEYLIARQGTDKIELLVNKRIIEIACQQRGLEVTAAEVEAAFEEDLKGVRVNRKEFIDNVLKQYGKSLYEWKEDVIKPRLMLTKLSRERVQVTEDEVRKAYDGEFGERVEVRIIIWPRGQEKFAFEAHERLRKSDEEFERYARQQAVGSLAATGGRIKPFGRGCGTHPEVEKEAFLLQPGEVSRLIATNDGTIMLKVDRLLPPDATARYEDHKERLTREVYDKKMAAEIPKLMKVLRDQANPNVILKKTLTAEDLERNALREIRQTGATAPAKP